MGKVDSFGNAMVQAGVECWFWSADHWPPHFTIRRPGEWQYKVEFLLEGDAMLKLEWADGKKRIGGKRKRELFKLVQQHREALLAEFDAKVVQHG